MFGSFPLAIAMQKTYMPGMKSSHPLKVIACCYCGARSTLPRTKSRVPLVCHGCGAAISKIEQIQPQIERAQRDKTHRKPAVPHPARPADKRAEKSAKRRKGKRKKGLWYHVTEAFDDIDDLFDVGDWFD